MDPLTSIILAVAIIATGTATVLGIRLNSAKQELVRARRRMARLDELADGVATLEFKAVPSTPEDEEEAPADTSDELLVSHRRNTPIPPANLTALDSGTFPAIGLAANTSDVFDDEDEEFAAPRMTSEVPQDRVQKPSRKRHETPVGSPRNLTPRSLPSVVEVGSIQVRADSGSSDK